MRKHIAKTKRAAPAPAAGATGTYVYDEKLGKVVKVSSRVPGMSKSGGFGDSADSDSGAGPCGRQECGGGSCAMGDN